MKSKILTKISTDKFFLYFVRSALLRTLWEKKTLKKFFMHDVKKKIRCTTKLMHNPFFCFLVFIFDKLKKEQRNIVFFVIE